MVILFEEPRYRHSYVEKDRIVRNSTGLDVPGVDTLQGFALPIEEFEAVFMEAAERYDSGHRRRDQLLGGAARRPSFFKRRRPSDASTDSAASVIRRLGSGKGLIGLSGGGKKEDKQGKPRADECRIDAATAERYADACRRDGARLQRGAKADYELAGAYYERAVRTRARHGLYCTLGNADAHAEYARNLVRRGRAAEAEYHLRTSADIHRILGACDRRRYGDVLLYTGMVVEKMGRVREAEELYRRSLGVYASAVLSSVTDDNARVAVDNLAYNLRAQGRGDDVDGVIRAFFESGPAPPELLRQRTPYPHGHPPLPSGD